MNETLREATRGDYDDFVRWLLDNHTLSSSFKHDLHARVLRMTENAYLLGRQDTRIEALRAGVPDTPPDPSQTDPDAPRGAQPRVRATVVPST